MAVTESRIDSVQTAIETRADAAAGSSKISLGDPENPPSFYPGIGYQEPGQAWGETSFARLLLSGLLDAIDIPVGVVLPFAGAPGALPPGWAIADGTNGTADLRGAYLKGALGAPPVPGPGTVINDGAGAAPVVEVVWIQKVE